MIRKLREELIKLSTEIITAREDSDLTQLYEKSKEIYEKLAVLKFIDEKLADVQVDVSKNGTRARARYYNYFRCYDDILEWSKRW